MIQDVELITKPLEKFENLRLLLKLPYSAHQERFNQHELIKALQLIVVLLSEP